jgi:hypothetical protein
LVVVLWLGACFQSAAGAQPAAWVRDHPWLNWFGNWEMFTLLDEGATLVKAEALREGRWEAIPLLSLFPTRWESGPRYARSAFFNDPQHMRVLGAATCGRLPTPPTAVRFYKLTWRKQPGVSSTRAPANAKRTELSTFSCGEAVELPRGRRI